MNRKDFYRKMLVIAIPIALQNLITVSVSMSDTIMLGSLGEVALSASSLANQLFFIYTLILYGTAGGSNVLIAQFWGKQDVKSIKKVLAYTYRVMLIFTFLMVFVAFCFPSTVMSFFSSDKQVIKEGAYYLRIISVSYLFFGITTITTNILRAIRTVKISLFSSIISLCVNVFLNWILIFGHFGVPRLGIVGAAVATTIARIIECCIIVIYMYRKEAHLKLRIKDMLHLDKKIGSSFKKNAMPVVCNELLWSSGTAILSVIIGHMGTQFTAAYSIYAVISQLACVLSQGLAASAAVMVGNTIGAGKSSELKSIIHHLHISSYITGLLAFCIVYLLRPLMPFIYDISATSMSYLMQILMIGACMEAFRPIAFVNMVGILRGGGDAKFVLVNDIIFLWVLCIPLGYVGGIILKLPIPIVFTILRSDDMIKLVTSFIRINRNHWVKNLTHVSEGT